MSLYDFQAPRTLLVADIESMVLGNTLSIHNTFAHPLFTSVVIEASFWLPDERMLGTLSRLMVEFGITFRKLVVSFLFSPSSS